MINKKGNFFTQKDLSAQDCKAIVDGLHDFEKICITYDSSNLGCRTNIELVAKCDVLDGSRVWVGGDRDTFPGICNARFSMERLHNDNSPKIDWHELENERFYFRKGRVKTDGKPNEEQIEIARQVLEYVLAEQYRALRDLEKSGYDA